MDTHQEIRAFIADGFGRVERDLRAAKRARPPEGGRVLRARRRGGPRADRDHPASRGVGRVPSEPAHRPTPGVPQATGLAGTGQLARRSSRRGVARATLASGTPARLLRPETATMHLT
jgi:hypothetical protein